jgi:hypothetical protein
MDGSKMVCDHLMVVSVIILLKLLMRLKRRLDRSFCSSWFYCSSYFIFRSICRLWMDRLLLACFSLPFFSFRDSCSFSRTLKASTSCLSSLQRLPFFCL